jgi:hypothetical protein
LSVAGTGNGMPRGMHPHPCGLRSLIPMACNHQCREAWFHAGGLLLWPQWLPQVRARPRGRGLGCSTVCIGRLLGLDSAGAERRLQVYGAVHPAGATPLLLEQCRRTHFSKACRWVVWHVCPATIAPMMTMRTNQQVLTASRGEWGGGGSWRSYGCSAKARRRRHDPVRP